MKTSTIALSLAALSLALNIYLLKRPAPHEGHALNPSSSPAEESPHAEEEHVLLGSMGYFQRFSTKLYWAGQAENWPLAGFYVHELEEILEELEEADIIEEGESVSALIKEIPFPVIEALEKHIENQDQAAFETSYQMLINSCNACHARTKKGFIQIKVPDTPAPYNQVF